MRGPWRVLLLILIRILIIFLILILLLILLLFRLLPNRPNFDIARDRASLATASGW